MAYSLVVIYYPGSTTTYRVCFSFPSN